MSRIEEHRALYDQARAIVGRAPRETVDRQGHIIDWSWYEEDVRQAFGEADDFRWFTLVLDLQRRKQATLCLYAAPWDGTLWEDQALDDWGTVDITPEGVLALAAVYGRGGR